MLDIMVSKNAKKPSYLTYLELRTKLNCMLVMLVQIIIKHQNNVLLNII